MHATKSELKLISDTIKTLSMDAVQKANSGHPGMPMGCADLAAVLWTRFIQINPDDEKWPNRDRFVLSAGHGSMLLYSLLHLSGFNLSLEDIKNFRQLHSRTPGHPEYGITPGVETSTGPLGQGFGNGVGMALAQQLLQQELGEESSLIDHYIYGIVSDGDLMEGISNEAASLAGHMGLGSIIYLYDDNDISIEGSTDLAMSEDVPGRFIALGWHVQETDGHDYDAIATAIEAAQKETSAPSLIVARTIIAHGSATKEGSEASHGAALGEDEVRATKEKIGWDPDAHFLVPEEVYTLFKKRREEWQKRYEDWQSRYESLDETTSVKWKAFFTKPDINELRKSLPVFEAGTAIATRGASGKVLESLFPLLPSLAGGSGDLGPSNKSFIKGYSTSGKGMVGRNIHFGVREHAMGAIQNGMAYYGGLLPYAATFFVFMDYMRPAIRMAALAGLQALYIFTHDSLFVGEDGPTHQPVEHLMAARLIPNLTVIRPADAAETAEAWLAALDRVDGPTALILTRQNLPLLERTNNNGAEMLHRGAYILHDTARPDVILYASGSEVSLALTVAEVLEEKKIAARVVSFPSWELFDEQEHEYKDTILPGTTPSVVLEAALHTGWERYVGTSALFITMDTYGVSGPWQHLAEEFGFTKEKAAEKILKFLKV